MDTLTLESLKEACEMISNRPTLLVGPDDMVFATLSAYALYFDKIVEIESLYGVDVLWSEWLDDCYEEEDALVIVKKSLSSIYEKRLELKHDSRFPCPSSFLDIGRRLRPYDLCCPLTISL